jgi:hypothetical protein
MTAYEVVGPHHYSFCPVCKASVAFFKPEKGSFTGGEVTLSLDSLVTLECSHQHGKFDVPVRDLLCEASGRNN